MKEVIKKNPSGVTISIDFFSKFLTVTELISVTEPTGTHLR